MTATKTGHWTITNLETGEAITLARDACHKHPEWVHRQCGTADEAALQTMMDDHYWSHDFIGRGPCSDTGINWVQD
jgi:hypothetical protein